MPNPYHLPAGAPNSKGGEFTSKVERSAREAAGVPTFEEMKDYPHEDSPNASDPSGKTASFTPEEGGMLYHGTAAPDDLEYFNDPVEGVVYMTDNYNQALGYGGKVHLGRGEVLGTPRVMEMLLAPGRMVNVQAAIEDSLDSSDDFKEVWDQVRRMGAEYAFFTHPNSYDDGEHNVIVAVNPSATIGSAWSGWRLNGAPFHTRRRRR